MVIDQNWKDFRKYELAGIKINQEIWNKHPQILYVGTDSKAGEFQKKFPLPIGPVQLRRQQRDHHVEI